MRAPHWRAVECADVRERVMLETVAASIRPVKHDARVPGAISAITRVFDALWQRAFFTRGALQPRDPGAESTESEPLGPGSALAQALAWPGHAPRTIALLARVWRDIFASDTARAQCRRRRATRRTTHDV